jgi:hypothetical protein
VKVVSGPALDLKQFGDQGTIVFVRLTADAAERQRSWAGRLDTALRGIVDLVVGNAIQASAQITTHQQLTPSAAAVGS